MNWRFTWLLLALALATGCPTTQDDDDSAGDDDAGDDDAGDDDTEDGTTISGGVYRDTDLISEGDGIGTLCIGVMFACAEDSALFGIQLDGADLTDEQVPVPFSIDLDESLLSENNPYYLGAMFVEEPTDCETHEIAGGEMVNGDCPTFTYNQGHDVGDLAIYLTTKMAWPAGG